MIFRGFTRFLKEKCGFSWRNASFYGKLKVFIEALRFLWKTGVFKKFLFTLAGGFRRFGGKTRFYIPMVL